MSVNKIRRRKCKTAKKHEYATKCAWYQKLTLGGHLPIKKKKSLSIPAECVDDAPLLNFPFREK